MLTLGIIQPLKDMKYTDRMRAVRQRAFELYKQHRGEIDSPAGYLIVTNRSGLWEKRLTVIHYKHEPVSDYLAKYRISYSGEINEL